MRVVERQGTRWVCVLHSGQRESDRYFRGRMKRYPDCWGSGSGWLRQAARQRQRRINQSVVSHVIMRKERSMQTRQRLTKMISPSASFCQRSTILLSSSSAALEYMEKRGPEPSPKLDSPCDGWDF